MSGLDANPYSTPDARLVDPSAPAVPAPRLLRLAAALVDALLLLAILVPLLWAAGAIDDARMMMAAHEPFPSAFSVKWGMVAFFVYVALQGWPLHRRGQSWGKRLFDLRVVDLEGRQASLQRLILFRQLPISVLGRIPVVGVVLVWIDLLFIFKASRRCLHDRIAGTRVVRGG